MSEVPESVWVQWGASAAEIFTKDLRRNNVGQLIKAAYAELGLKKKGVDVPADLELFRHGEDAPLRASAPITSAMGDEEDNALVLRPKPDVQQRTNLAVSGVSGTGDEAGSAADISARLDRMELNQREAQEENRAINRRMTRLINESQSVTFSSVAADKEQALLEELGLAVLDREYAHVRHDWGVDDSEWLRNNDVPFAWGEAVETAQNKLALVHFIAGLSCRRVSVALVEEARETRTDFECVSLSPDLTLRLNCFTFRGNVDGVISKCGVTLEGLWRARVLVELKKPGADFRKALRQQVVQLVSAALKCSGMAPVSLLTDLGTRWCVLSFGIGDDGSIELVRHDHVDMASALDYVASVLLRPARGKGASASDSVGGSPDSSRRPFTRRVDWNAPRGGSTASQSTQQQQPAVPASGDAGGPSDSVAAGVVVSQLRLRVPHTACALDHVLEQADSLGLFGYEAAQFVAAQLNEVYA